MLGSFDKCKYMNVCNLLNLCMFLVEKLRVIEMNEVLIGESNVNNEYMGNVNVRSECGNRRMLGLNVLIGAI